MSGGTEWHTPVTNSRGRNTGKAESWQEAIIIPEKKVFYFSDYNRVDCVNFIT